ncbi:MAG TPA: hypothetical protein VIV63_05385 [Steroidobacteraceae bacterium]
MNKAVNISAIAAAVFLAIAGQALAHEPKVDGCDAASPDIALELAVMRSPAIPVTAVSGKDSPYPELQLDKHYAISLIAQSDLEFPAKPRRSARNQAPRGGILRFEVPAAGRYRISTTSRHWIDVVDGKSVVTSASHEGPECEILHKIVEFDLPAARPLTLQISGRDDAIIGLAITLSPTAPKQDSK